jgi:hypothetical protein
MSINYVVFNYIQLVSKLSVIMNLKTIIGVTRKLFVLFHFAVVHSILYSYVFLSFNFEISFSVILRSCTCRLLSLPQFKISLKRAEFSNSRRNSVCSDKGA